MTVIQYVFKSFECQEKFIFQTSIDMLWCLNTLFQKSIFCQKKLPLDEKSNKIMKNHRKSLFRVTYFIQIRVGWSLQISKIQRRFLDKNWTFNIVWCLNGKIEFWQDNKGPFFVPLPLFTKVNATSWKIIYSYMIISNVT